MNTLYHYNVEFSSTSLIGKLKLYFEQDVKSIYKIGVRVIAPDVKGNEVIILNKIYDENIYHQLCDKAHKEANTQYYGSSSTTHNGSTSNNDASQTKSEEEA
jgi:hypothetical protein